MPAGDLTSVANVKEHLGIATAQAGDNAFLTNLITRCSAFLMRVTRRNLTAAARADIEDGTGTEFLRLRDWPAVSIGTVWEDPDQNWTTSTVVAAADYILQAGGDGRPARLIKKSGIPWARFPQSVKVQWTAGYATIPTDLEMIALEVIANKWRRRRNEGLASKSTPDGTLVMFSPSDINADIRRLLAPHIYLRPVA